MKVKIKSFNGVLPEYLTEDKEYDAFPNNNGKGATITNDLGDKSFINLAESCHLNGGSWEIVE